VKITELPLYSNNSSLKFSCHFTVPIDAAFHRRASVYKVTRSAWPTVPVIKIVSDYQVLPNT